jgi:hypothetical protein
MTQLLQDKLNAVSQYNGTLPHIHNVVTIFFNRQLPKQWINQEESTAWPLRSPDLTSDQILLVGLCER